MRQAHLDKELLLTVKNEKDLNTINDLIAKDIDDRTRGVFYYTWSGNLGKVELLVSKDVSVNATDKYGCTLLHWSALKGHSDIAKFLVDKGANVNAKDILGRTPMHFAAMNNHNDIQDACDRGPMYTAAESNDEEFIQLFLMKGASINEADKNGETPLHLASWGGHLDILQRLISNGADISAKDSSDRTPLDVARDKGHNNLAQCLQQIQLVLDKQLLIAIGNSDLNKVRGLVAQGANIDTNDKNGNTLLYSAAEIGDLNLVKLLLDNGANIEAKNGEYQATPLHGAVENYRIDVVKLLLNCGANVNAEDKDNWTPLHYAADTNSLDIVKVLVDAHANLGAKGNYGKTPLDIAKDKGHNNIMEYLEQKLREERGKPLQRKRRHHHGDHNHHHSHLSHKPLAIGSSNQPEIAASSGTRTSSWINNCISWVKKLAVSTFPIIPGLPAQYNIADKNDDINVKGDNNNIPQNISSVGWDNLLNNENIALASCVADALDDTPSRRYQNLISKGVEVIPSREVAVEFALRKFDSFVEGKIRNLGLKEQARIRVEIKDAYPEITASLEKGVEFSGNIGLDDVLEKCKECFYENILPSNSNQEAPGFKRKRQLNNTLNIKNGKETQKTVDNEIANKGDSSHAISGNSSGNVHKTDQDCRGLDNLIVGEAIANGSCFFDSFRQGLEQKKGIKVTVEQLRNDCKGFAQDSPPEWFKHAIAHSYDNNGQCRNETVGAYITNIIDNNRWGDPEVEGRILCERYGVKLHVVENNSLRATDNQQDRFLHQLIDNESSKSVGEYNVDYDDNSVLHMINKGDNHFQPLLDRNKSLTKQVKGYSSLSEPQDETIYDLPRSNMNEIMVNQHQASTIRVQVYL